MLKRQWTTAAWALVILVLSGIPGNYIPRVVSFLEWLTPDKLVHLLEFGVLSFLVLYNVREQYFQSKRRYLFVVVAVAGSAAYGVLTEILQHYVFIGRSGNAFDALADLLGALAGWLFFHRMFRKKYA